MKRKINLQFKKFSLFKKTTIGFLLVFCIVVFFNFSHSVCSDARETIYGQCSQYVSFIEIISSQRYGILKYIGSLVVLLILYVYIVSISTRMLKMSKLSLYGRALVTLLYTITIFSFLGVSFLVSVYTGSSCLVDNCVNMSLFKFIFWWGLLAHLMVLLSPLFWVSMALLFFGILTYEKIQKNIRILIINAIKCTKFILNKINIQHIGQIILSCILSLISVVVYEQIYFENIRKAFDCAGLCDLSYSSIGVVNLLVGVLVLFFSVPIILIDTIFFIPIAYEIYVYLIVNFVYFYFIISFLHFLINRLKRKK